MFVEKRCPIGVDLGIGGGLVLLDGREIAFVAKTPRIKLGERVAFPIPEDEKQRKAQAKRKTKQFNPDWSIYDLGGMVELVREAERVAIDRGYCGALLVVERYQLHIGKSHPRNYFSMGACYEGWQYAGHARGMTVVAVDPNDWKPHFGLTSDKQQSLDLARSSFSNAQELGEDDNLCEAALLAKWATVHLARRLSLTKDTHE